MSLQAVFLETSSNSIQDLPHAFMAMKDKVSRQVIDSMLMIVLYQKKVTKKLN